MPSSAPRRRLLLASLCALLPALVVCAGGSPPGAESPPPQMPSRTLDLPDVKKLIADQKFSEADQALDRAIAEARKRGDDAMLAYALIGKTVVQTALGGYETAVRDLKTAAWPKSGLPLAVVQLYYAHALTTYAVSYGWEIGRREKVDTKGVVDLKSWTRDQIAAEALTSFAKAWAHRDELGARPIGELAPYLEPNTYPSNVRGSLRDALAYLTVAQLANTSLWRPDQANEVWRLDLGALLERGVSAPLDGEGHPLAKLVAVLDDLEAFHKKGGRHEAALEAYLERLTRLYASFTEKGDRARIEQALVARLDKERDRPWWSMGQALLAGWARANERPILAHRLATQGRDAYPSSMGGRACSAILSSLERPEYHLTSMAVDGASRPSVVVQARNLDRLYFRAYPVNLRTHLETRTNYGIAYDTDDAQKLLGKKPVATWETALPATADYGFHRTLVTPPLQKHGAYAIVASARPDFAETNNFIAAVLLQVSDLVLTLRIRDDQVVATVLDGPSGRLVANANVELWKVDWRHTPSVTESKRTDKKGEARFQRSGDHAVVASVTAGGDFTLDTDQMYLGRRGTDPDRVGTLIYTDRSVYRPGQKVAWKAVVYTGRRSEGRFQVASNRTVVLSLRDANYQEVQKVEASTNEYGSIHGEFVIPTGRLLGRWQLVSSLGGAQAIQVEEYKRPTFEVSLKPPASSLRINEPAKLIGEARYYFGLPVTSGQAKYTVTRTLEYPRWWGWYRRAAPPEHAQTVARGVASLAADGSFEVRFVPEVSRTADPALTYNYAVSVDITDEGGETRSASRNYRVGKSTVEATLSRAVGFFDANKPGVVTVRRTDLDGTPRPGVGTWQIVRLDEPAQTVLPADAPIAPPPLSEGSEAKTVTAGDRQHPRYETTYSPQRALGERKDGHEIGKGTIATDAQGNAELKLPALAAGAYRIRYRTNDDHGTPTETMEDVVVAGDKPLGVPLWLALDRPQGFVGDKARVLLSSGLSNQTILLDTFRDQERILRQVVDGKQGVIEVPITEADRGGLVFVATLVRDHQLVTLEQTLSVPWDNQALKLSFSTFRDKLRPGGQETFRVTVEGDGNRKGRLGAGAAELLAYMYDRSLDLFAPHSPPSPLGLYPFRATAGSLRTSLREQSQLHLSPDEIRALISFESPRPDRFKFEDGYGLGGLGLRGYGRGGGGDRTRAMPMRALVAPAPESSTVARTEASDEVNIKEEQKKAKADTPEPAARVGKDRSEAGQGTDLRTNFSETAFFAPALLTNEKGEASFEFTVPDSVTSWNVWVHAITKDLRSGSLAKETRSVKDLMVRPYLPRFFREGDEAELKVVVNNAGTAKLDGELTFDIIDPETRQSRIAEFGGRPEKRAISVEGGKSTNLTFAVKAPRKLGTFAIVAKATAKAGNDQFSDGELRPIPVLPSRLHLAQSRFVSLRDSDKRTMRFADLAANDDPTRVSEQLVVTLDAQLFYTVLRALPYLINYPHECAEQTLNRFVSTGIVSSLFAQYPAVAKMADRMSRRTTQLQAWDAGDANRKMGLEEAPFLFEAQGGHGSQDDSAELISVLDQRIARANRDSALARLQKMQLGSGGFPWFPGGPPSPYMTLYVLMGLSRAAEFKVDVPKPMVQRAFSYLGDYVRREYAPLFKKDDCCWELLTLASYVASSFPDASYSQGGFTVEERGKMLEFGFRHWKQHSPYLKGMLALTLQRANRKADAKKVFDSVMDSAKTTRDEGTFWQPEDRSWLWYNDTIESHAFALRVLMEVDPKNPKKDGLVLWLLLNKKLNQWKSTRATAEVLYSLAKYMVADGSLGVREGATVAIGPRQQSYTFEPDHYVGKVQMVVPGPEVDAKSADITVEKKTKGVMFASATWSFATDQLPKEGRGDFFTVSRHYFLRENNGREFTLRPLADGATIRPGDEIEVQLAITSKHDAEYVHLRDPRAAGFEPVSLTSRYKWELGVGFYEEVRDSGTNFFFERLPVGQYTFKYRLRATTGGTYRVGPATLQSMYAPEFNAYSAGHVVKIAGR